MEILSRVFLLQSHLSKFARGTWTRNLDNCGLPCYKLSRCYAPIPGRQSRVPCPGGNPNLDKNLDKELGQVLSRVFLLQSHLSKFARGTWTRNLDNCWLPCYKLSQYYAPIPGRPRFRVPLSLEGVSQMDSILPERLPALVRPAFDLVLRRIRSLKRCVQACGCKIMTPRYAPQFGSRLHFKRCQPLPKETPFPLGPLFSFFWFFLSPAKVGSLEMQPGAKLQAYLGVIILQPHACTQRFRLVSEVKCWTDECWEPLR